MHKSVRVLVSLLLGLVMITGAIALAGSSTAAPARAALPRATAPCGQPNYPPCPPQSSITVSPTTVRRGQFITISVRHYPPNRPVTVHLAGHGRYIFLGSSRTGPHGNTTFSVRVPRHIPLGRYTLFVQVGHAIKSFTIHVVRG